MESFTSVHQTWIQVIGVNQDPWMETQALHQEICHLKDLLTKERENYFREHNLSSQLNRELQETKQQLKYQKGLKEMIIHKEKESRKELESLQKYGNKDIISSIKVPAQTKNAKRRKKKDLQKDYEELQVVHIASQERFHVDMLEEKKKNEVLQQQLVELRASYRQLSEKYRADMVAAKQQAEQLQQQLQKEIQTHEDMVAQDKVLVQSLRDEQDALHRQMAKEVQVLQQRAAEQEAMLRQEIEELRGDAKEKECPPEPKQMEMMETTKASVFRRVQNFLGLSNPPR